MFLGLLDLGPAKNILKNASLSTDYLTSGEHAQCLSALLCGPLRTRDGRDTGCPASRITTP